MALALGLFGLADNVGWPNNSNRTRCMMLLCVLLVSAAPSPSQIEYDTAARKVAQLGKRFSWVACYVVWASDAGAKVGAAQADSLQDRPASAIHVLIVPQVLGQPLE